jgi:outer membrane protein TolC
MAVIATMVGLVPPAMAQVPLERVTLAEALDRAVQLDPNYVTALGALDNAEWSRRAARLAFVLPSLSAQLDGTRYSRPAFNTGTGALSSIAINARAFASYELLSLRKFTDLEATAAGAEAAQAGVAAQRFQTALATERDFYQVITDRELLRVAEERVQRGRQQLQVGRARVLSGAAVQSDSLTLVLELTQAEIARAQQTVALEVDRAELGRRIGAVGPVDADPGADVSIEPLPLSLGEALSAALEQGPQYRAARQVERQNNALYKGSKSTYLPSVTVNAASQRFDSKFFPGALKISQLQVVVAIPIWNIGQRETAVLQARVNRDVARAIRVDLERAALRDVTQAYQGYTTANEILRLANTEVQAARENYRVQDLRYRSGATTILDIVEAQFRLAQAEGDVVQARFAGRLALAGLEAILGRRLFPR